jgi:hypothetical protein
MEAAITWKVASSNEAYEANVILLGVGGNALLLKNDANDFY